MTRSHLPRPLVLLVDDDAPAREALAEALEPLECEVHQAGTSSEAEARLRATAYQIVVLDVALPDGTGFSLAERLGGEGLLRGAMVVFLTGLELTDEVLGKALALGCGDLITKPVLPPIFRARLGVLLKLARANHNLELREAELRQTAQMVVETLRKLSAVRRARKPVQPAMPASGSMGESALTAANEVLETLRLSEERYRLAALASNDVLWDWEVGAGVMHWSAALASVLGHGVEVREGFCETSPGWRSERIHPDDRAAVEESLGACLRSRAESWSCEYRFQTGAGDYAQVLDRCCVVRDEDGSAVRLVGAMQNVTLFKEQEALARAQADFQQQLIGIVSHDLRNPIGAISLGASVMLNRGDLSGAQTLSAKQIQASADRATRMVRDLLDFTRARLGGGIPVQPRALDLRLLAEQVVREALAGGEGRKISVQALGDLSGTWDPDRLSQAIQNLVGNALAYSPPGSEVAVKLDGSATEVKVSVHNPGEPIPPEQLPHLFEPLRRGKARANANVSRSIGLGLYIVQNIARAHGGTVEVCSTEAEGTTFTLVLPRHSGTYTARSSGVFSLRALNAARRAL